MDALQYDKQLVAFDTTSARSNAEISDFIEQRLRALEFEIERLEYTDDAGVTKVNLVGKKGAGSGGLAYFGHTDVVPADDWFSTDHGPFQATEADGKLYGRGSVDMKGSIASMLAAAEQFAAADLRQPIYITCTADEEIGYGGAAVVAERSRLFREMVDGDARGIIGEPTLLEVVYAHKGTCGIVATSHGKAAHSSTAEGLNANLAMIPFLAEMKRIHDETLEDPAWRNDEFDPPTISWNIGINDHTRAVNIKAAQSVCTVYFRPMPGQDPEVLLSRARGAAQQCGVELQVRSSDGPLYVDPRSDFVGELLRLTGREQARTVSYGTDGAKLTALQKMVVLGPGNIAQAHTHDEWIDLRQLELGTELYAKLIRAWCCS